VTTRSCKSFCPSLGRRSGLTGLLLESSLLCTIDVRAKSPAWPPRLPWFRQDQRGGT
jgi:hypothetical protein